MRTQATAAGGRTALSQSLSTTFKAYFRLTKPKIALLLLISTAAGMLAAGGGSVSWGSAFALLAGGYLCAGGAGALNCYLDREMDLLMPRTKSRPLPAGQLSPRRGLAFSVGISLLSVPVLLMVGPLVTVLSIVAWVYYVLVYSVILKPRTSQNILLGGAAGAFPPLIGWVAVEGSIDLSAIFLFLIVFFWTPPHAYALMLVLKDQYRRVNIPMLPVVKGERETGRQILLYSLLLVAVTIAPVLLGLFGLIFLATALATGAVLIAMAIKLYSSLSISWSARLFRYSTLYLAVLFVGLVLDRTLVLS